MSLTVHDRTEWQDPAHPVTGPAPMPDRWQAVVYHYPGSNNAVPVSLSGLFALCRAMQLSYLNTRGYSLGYNFLIGPNGDTVEVRGLDIRNAANNGVQSKTGVSNYNSYTVSVQFVVTGNAPATNAQLAAAAELHVKVIEPHVGRILRVEGHGDKDATPCPGAGINGQLPQLANMVSDARRPPATPIPPYTIPEGDEMITGLWKCPNDPGIYQCCSNRTKIWCYPGTVDEAQALLRLEGKSDAINVQTSAEMFRAFGPVVGPRPAGVDEYGWKD